MSVMEVSENSLFVVQRSKFRNNAKLVHSVVVKPSLLCAHDSLYFKETEYSHRKFLFLQNIPPPTVVCGAPEHSKLLLKTSNGSTTTADDELPLLLSLPLTLPLLYNGSHHIPNLGLSSISSDINSSLHICKYKNCWKGKGSTSNQSITKGFALNQFATFDSQIQHLDGNKKGLNKVLSSRICIRLL
jgi:hypothetical protein